MTRVLILGGTGEAAGLARRLVARGDLEVVSSLAGRTRAPAAVPGRLRVGGFGGVAGLVAYLEAESIDRVVDATHPFAATMSAHAAEACAAAGVPRLLLLRPPWRARPGDRWTRVASIEAAAAAVAGLGRRAFLSVGRQELAAFADCADVWFLVRLIDPPEAPLPLARHELLLARGPFDAGAEADLLRRHAVELVVSKNSGGAATYAKIEAARTLGLPVLMVERPEPPPGPRVESVEGVLRWIDATPGAA